MEGDPGMSDVGRLAVPKRRQYNHNFDTDATMAGLPPDPLPTWTTLPLDHKLPMVPGPKGVISLFTTNLGEKIHKRSHELDFDLTDPYAMELSNDYKVLHDPHLKLHLTNPQMKRRLYRGGFITKDGKVLCTLKEFNEYRHYLRKINLLMEKRRERENKKLNGSSQVQQTKKESEAMRLRELKIKEIRERLSKQFEEDRSRYVQLIREKEERRRKIRQDQLSRLSEKERKIRKQEERRQIIVQRRQIEERRRKLEKLRKWIYDDEERFARAQIRRQKLEHERQRKMEDNWEERKRLQQQRLQDELDKQKMAEDSKQKRIVEREEVVAEHRKKQQEVYLQIIEKQRKEKQLIEQAYADNLSKRLERKRLISDLKRRKRKGKGRKRLESNWDIGKTLQHLVSLDDISGIDGRRLDTLKEEKELKSSSNALGVREHGAVSPSDVHMEKADGGLQPPTVTSDSSSIGIVSPRPSALDMYHVLKNTKHVTLRRPTPAVADDISHLRNRFKKDGRLEGFSEGESDEEMEDVMEEPAEDVEKAAEAIVDMSLYLTTKVIYPAYLRWLKEDHPDEYVRHVDQTTVLSDEETSEAVLTQKGKKKVGGVKFTAHDDVLPSNEDVYVQDDDDDDEQIAPLRSGYGSDDEEVPVNYNRKLSLSYKDSVTRLLSKVSIDTSLSQDAQELEQILRLILDELSSGKLKGTQVAELISIARSILDSLQSLEGSQDEQSSGALTPEMMNNPTSQSSLLAREIVQQTLSKVKRDLLLDDEFIEKYQREAYEEGTPIESVSSLSRFIVNKVITSAVHSLQAVSEETIRLGSSGGARPSSAPATPDRGKRRDLPDLVQEEAPIQVRSETSDLVWTVLQRTAKEVEAEIMRANPTKQASEMSEFVRHVISQAAQELVANASGSYVNWDRSNTMQSVDSKTSDISYFVQHTISKVLNDMEKEGLIPRVEGKVEQTASSVFVEHLIELTLQQCLGEVKEQMIPKDDLVNMAAAIIESHQNARAATVLDRGSPSRTRSLGAIGAISGPGGVSSMLVETFIKETLSKVLTDIKMGNMSLQDITTLAQAFDHTDDGGTRSDRSIQANEFVQQALECVLQELNFSEYKTIDIDKAQEILGIPESKESNEANELLTKAFTGVIEEITGSVLPVKSKSSQEVEVFIKAVLKRATADICNPMECRTLTPAPQLPQSKSSEELEEFIYDLIDRNAAELAGELGIKYKQSLTKRLSSNASGGTVDILKVSCEATSVLKKSSQRVSIGERKSKLSTDSVQLQNKSSIELTNYIQDIIAENKEIIAHESLPHTPIVSSGTPCSKSSEDLTEAIKQIISSAAKDVAENVEIDPSNKDIQDRLKVTASQDHSIFSVGTSGHTSDMHIIVDKDHEVHEDSSDEALVEPILGSKPLSIDHTVIENALSILSVKKDHDLNHIHQYDAVPRNSFMSLQHPNVAMVKRLNSLGSDQDVCKKILNLSSRCIETLAHDSEDEGGSSSSSTSGSSDSLEEEVKLGETDKVISVQNLHTSLKGPDDFSSDKGTNDVSSVSQPTAVASVSAQKQSTASLKQKTSSPYHSRVSTPKSQSIANAKVSSSNTLRNSKASLPPKPTKIANTPSTNSRIKAQPSPVNSRTASKPISQTTPKVALIKDQKVTGSFPKMHVKKYPEGPKVRSEGSMKPNKISESSVKQTKLSTMRQKSKTQSIDSPQKSNVSMRKSKVTSDGSNKSLHQGKSKTTSSKGKMTGVPSKAQVKAKTSSKTITAEAVIENVDVKGKVSQPETEKEVEDVNNNTPLSNNNSKATVENIGNDSETKVTDTVDVVNESVNKAEEKSGGKEIIEEDKKEDNKEKVKDIDEQQKTGQTPQAQSIEIGSLSINLVEENAVNVRQGSNVSLKSAPAEMLPEDGAEHIVKEKNSTDDVLEEIEEDIQPVRRISARKSARSSTGDQYGYVPTMHSSSDKLSKTSSQGKTVEMISSSFPQLQNKPSKVSVKSSQTSRASHHTVNLTPRPSSGYSKSPTPQIINQLSGPLPNTSSPTLPPSRELSSDSAARNASSVTSRLIKSISSLGDKIFGRKGSNNGTIEERNIISPSGQLLMKKKSKGSLIVLGNEDNPNVQPGDTAAAGGDEDKPKSHSSKTTVSELSKINSVITLSPKQSKSSLRDLSVNVNNSSGGIITNKAKTSQTYYTHSDNEDEEEPKEQSSGHTRAGHHSQYHHQHTKECPSTGSLPELESHSHAIMKVTNQNSDSSITAKSKGSWTSPRQSINQ